MDAIKMMADGRAAGKGLNVKGKSAKKGALSGYVPFLQISEEAHKLKVATSPPDARIRVYYASEELRAAAHDALRKIMLEMVATAEAASEALMNESASGESLPPEQHEAHLKALSCSLLVAPTLLPLDGCAGLRGLDMPERLLWEAYVMRQDISHPPGWETGRASEPDYMDMNLHSTRERDREQPRVVVYQHCKTEPLNPRGLLIAYEEDGRVKPVASDFDAFLIGSRGVHYPPTPQWQLPFLDSMIEHVASILATPDERSWTHRWLEVLKGNHPLVDAKTGARQPSAIGGSLGRKRQDGPFGFGDDVSKLLIRELCFYSSVVKQHGAVRHAAECFNYYFPQELDEEFLVLWHGFDASPVRRRYFRPTELRAFLIARASEGYSFPLNPCWCLRDAGWFEVLGALEANPQCQMALDAWLPPSSGLRERMQAIRRAHPQGFVPVRMPAAEGDSTTTITAVDGTAVDDGSEVGGGGDGGDGGRTDPDGLRSERAGEEAFDRADLALRRHAVLRSARLKTRALLLWNASQTKGGDLHEAFDQLQATVVAVAAKRVRIGVRIMRKASEQVGQVGRRGGISTSKVVGKVAHVSGEIGMQIGREAIQATRTLTRQATQGALKTGKEVGKAVAGGAAATKHATKEFTKGLPSTSIVGKMGLWTSRARKAKGPRA